MIEWTNEHRAFLNAMPFVGMWVGERAADRPLVTRWIENVFTAILAAGLMMWKNDGVQDFKLQAMEAIIRDMRTDSRAELAQLRSDVSSLRIELATHANRSIINQERKATK